MVETNFKNFARGCVSGSHTASATSITLETGHGARFPSAPATLVIWVASEFSDPVDAKNDGPDKAEVVEMTAIVGDVLTVTRAEQGTTALDMTDTRLFYFVTTFMSDFFASNRLDVYNVKAYGAKGDGTTDDTIAIQAAIDAAIAVFSGTVYFPPGTYKSGNLTVFDALQLTITGSAATMAWTGTGEPNGGIGFEFSGTCADIVLENLEMSGDGVAANRHLAAWVPATATISRFIMRNLYVHDVTMGLLFDKPIVNGFEITGNKFVDVVGTASILQGTAIFLDFGGTGDAYGLITHNHFVRTDLRCIYFQAGSHVIISNNHFEQHRNGITPPGRNSVCAIRGDNVLVQGNVFENCQDSCISAEAGSSNVIISGNDLQDCEGNADIIWIGDSDPATNGTTTDIIIQGNRIQQDAENSVFVQLVSGIRIKVAGNLMIGTNQGSNRHRFIELEAAGETAGTSTYSDDWEISGNHIYGTKTTEELHAFAATAPWDISGVRTIFRSNWINVPDEEFTRSATVTNSNIQVVGQNFTGLDITSTPEWGVGTLKLWTNKMVMKASTEILSDSGAPTLTPPDGSFYLRNGGGGGVYVRESSAWNKSLTAATILEPVKMDGSLVIISGSAAPTATEASGSFYLRTTGQVYVTTGGGTWVEVLTAATILEPVKMDGGLVIISGAAAPTATEASGSLYLRTTGQVYVTTGGGTWAELAKV